MTKETDPIRLFDEYFAAAKESEPGDATACALATADAGGAPSVRMVLLKKADAEGFMFFTNLESRKGEELRVNPQAAMCFYWDSIDIQVRVEGKVTPVSTQEADAYFATRPRASQIGTWASDQSRPMEGMLALEKRVAKFAAKHAIGKVPRPPFWSGFRLVPVRIEFWHRRSFRLHERIVYDRQGDGWSMRHVYP
ncbi:MAG: pyridoxamine 5'-phosphate oxidase [Alphaproteobacteria bacterium]|nr:pyridoxamine 5'-phosphate oxidase [Alphaproteobacteria bacterium]